MKIIVILPCMLALLLNMPVSFAASDGAGAIQKSKLSSMLKDLKEKSKNIKPVKYEVTVPVATAGARGAETRQADRFAVIWPDSGISPLTALAENMRNAAERGAKEESLKAQLEDFRKAFPEFQNEKLLQELADVVQKAK